MAINWENETNNRWLRDMVEPRMDWEDEMWVQAESRFGEFIPEFKDCSCCQGMVYSCRNASCSSRGECITCQGALEEFRPPPRFIYAFKDCVCCSGVVNGCGNPACEAAGICVVCHPEALDEDKEDPTPYLIFPKFESCRCCSGAVYSCSNDLCRDLGVCVSCQPQSSKVLSGPDPSEGILFYPEFSKCACCSGFLHCCKRKCGASLEELEAENCCRCAL